MRAGDYQVSIKFNDQSIPDSPFNVYVSPSGADLTTLDITDLDQQVCQVCLFYRAFVGVNVNSMSMSKTFIGGAVCPAEFESEVTAAEEMLHRVVCSREQFSFQMCLKGGDGSRTFGN